MAEEAYRIYVTDSIKLLAEGKCSAVRYVNIIKPAHEDDREPDEIIGNIKDKLNKMAFDREVE